MGIRDVQLLSIGVPHTLIAMTMIFVELMTVLKVKRDDELGVLTEDRKLCGSAAGLVESHIHIHIHMQIYYHNKISVLASDHLIHYIHHHLSAV